MQPVPHGALRRHLRDLREQFAGGRSGAAAAGGGEGRGGRDRDGPREGLRVGVGDLGGEGRLGDGLVQVAGEPRAERCDPHRRAVAEAALTAEQLPALGPPVGGPVRQDREQPAHTAAVAAGRIGEEGRAEGQRQVLLVHGVLEHQHAQQRERHRGVVGPVPGRLRRGDPVLDLHRRLLRRAEQPEPALPEGVAERETLQRVVRGGGNRERGRHRSRVGARRRGHVAMLAAPGRRPHAT